MIGDRNGPGVSTGLTDRNDRGFSLGLGDRNDSGVSTGFSYRNSSGVSTGLSDRKVRSFFIGPGDTNNLSKSNGPGGGHVPGDRGESYHHNASADAGVELLPDREPLLVCTATRKWNVKFDDDLRTMITQEK